MKEKEVNASDFDGTIIKTTSMIPNPSIEALRLFGWLFIVVLPLTFLAKPNRKGIEKIKELEKGEGSKIIIISARPNLFVCRLITILHLRILGVPFSELYLVGPGKGSLLRKIQIMKFLNIDIYYEGDRRAREKMNNLGVDARPLL